MKVFVLYLINLLEILIFLGIVDSFHPLMFAKIDVAQQRINATFVFNVFTVEFSI